MDARGGVCLVAVVRCVVGEHATALPGCWDCQSSVVVWRFVEAQTWAHSVCVHLLVFSTRGFEVAWAIFPSALGGPMAGLPGQGCGC